MSSQESSIGSRIFGLLQKVGKSLMTPVSVLPAAGLLVAFGRLLEDSESHVYLMNLGKFMFSGGIAIFEQLPVVFAVGVAIGFTGGAGIAGLASVVGYFTLTNVLKVMTEVRGLELSINTGVFGGIIIGLLSAYLYKRFYQTKLHPVLGFFAGKRLVPIVTAASSVFVGVLLGLIWPPVQEAINNFGTMVMSSDLGPAFYAAGKRLLIPVGLHHVYYQPFLYEFGEFVTETGKVINGESVRYFAGDPTAGRFMAAEYPIMLFGLPAACVAMYLRAPKEKRAAIGGVMLTAALTSIITGITEPIEFAFIFVAPLLYVFHVAGAFCAGLLTNAFDIQLGYTFSASLIDFGVGYFNQKNSMYLWLVVGPLISILYFGVFYWLIKLFNFKTPGREIESEETMTFTNASEKAMAILNALGGKDNIAHIDACITRLRLEMNSTEKVDQAALKSIGASGIMVSGKNMQVIFGTESDSLKEEIKSLMTGSPVSNNTSVPKEDSEAAPLKNVKALTMRSPLVGKIINIADVPDATFAQKILGDGVAVEPTEGILYAPVDGEVAQLFHTNHALGIKTENGSEVLLHVGIDTVKMNGEGFKAYVKVGDSVKAGDKLIEFDLNLIREKAKSDITPFVITNMHDVSHVEILASGSVNQNQDIMTVTMQ
ncbi:MAG: glucose PTS transporter subunit IIA [Bdellovibrionota bacterium]|nr:glucose PTS transporter subunit IIA [Bdellovibrionota bacterium]